MSETSQNIFTSIKKSRILQLVLIGILVLVLKIPVFMISNLIRERQGREHEATMEVTSKWGNEQAMTGPALVIPYKYHWKEIGEKGKTIERTQTRFATFLQYLLLGFALCVFYLLELSLSEHMRFAAAYAIAAIAIIVMITGYGKVMLKTFKKAAIVGSIVIALYAYLYIILCNEDYAILMGSIGLFLILGLIMFLTRQVNWSDANA